MTRVTFIMEHLLKLLKKKFNLIAKKSSVYKIIEKFKITRKRIKKKFIYGKVNIHTNKIKQFKNQIKNINMSDIISIDETSIDTHIHNIYGWSMRGTKISKIIRKLKKRYTVICAISKAKIIHYKIIKGSANAQLFKQFVEELVIKGVKNKYLLMDNAKIHHSKILKKYMDLSENKILYNVPYSPEYNPIEQLFSKLKLIIRRKLNNQNPKNLKDNIKTSLKRISSNELNNYYTNSLIKNLF